MMRVVAWFSGWSNASTKTREWEVWCVMFTAQDEMHDKQSKAMLYLGLAEKYVESMQLNEAKRCASHAHNLIKMLVELEKESKK